MCDQCAGGSSTSATVRTASGRPPGLRVRSRTVSCPLHTRASFRSNSPETPPHCGLETLTEWFASLHTVRTLSRHREPFLLAPAPDGSPCALGPPRRSGRRGSRRRGATSAARRATGAETARPPGNSGSRSSLEPPPPPPPPLPPSPAPTRTTRPCPGVPPLS